jgi:SWI/SNF-related matrix-associated actin-dependent regulator of chromatin subfamily A member 5
MDDALQQTHEKLRSLRARKDLGLKPTPLLRDTYMALDGSERPFQLRYYQVQMIFHLLAMRRFIVGDDMGLGKTIESIAALCYMWAKDPNRKVIVLTKKSSIGQWETEFARFTRGVRCVVAKGTPAERKGAYEKFQKTTGPSVLIVGYRAAVKDFDTLQEWKGYILITDEATVYKNPVTQVHQVCRHLGAQADRVWGLTGTLIKNNLIEGYGIYQVVVPGLFKHTRNAFMKDYCVIRMQPIRGGRRVPVIVGYRDSDILRFRDKIDPFYLGRPKHEVATELPALTSKDIVVGLTPFQQQKYDEALEGLLGFGNGEERETDPLTAITYCQEIANHPCLIDFEDSDSEKMDALIDLLTDGGDLEGEKVVVFTRFRKLVDWAIPYMEKQGIHCTRITGDEDEDERTAAQDSFQSAKSPVQVIWITMAGGEAINLQAARAMVFYESPWSAGDYLQILGRIIRIGSLHDRVYALHLVAKGTVDERVREVRKKKMKLIEAVLGKRIKGEEDESLVFEVVSETKEIYDALVQDAKKSKGNTQ